MNNFVVGIDVGSSKVCASVGKVDRLGNLQILGVTSVTCSGINNAIIADVVAVSESIKQCVTQLESMAQIHINDTYISLPSGICNLIDSKGILQEVTSEDGIIKETDVKKVLEDAKKISVGHNSEVVGIIPVQYIVDGCENINNPLGMSGTKLEVEAKIIAANSEELDKLCQCFSMANITIDGVLMQSVGTSEVLLTREEISAGVALVDVGSDTINISIYKKGSLRYITSVNMGGNIITNDISVCLKVSFDEAERIKIKYGNVREVEPDDDEIIRVINSLEKIDEVKYSILSEIIEARVEEILSFINKKIQQSGFNRHISSVVITGGGISLFSGITEMSERILGKSVKVVSPNYVGVSSPLYSDCIGVVHHFKNNPNNGSAIEEEVHIESNEEEDFFHKEKSNKKEKGLFNKIKNFLGDFF